MKKSAQVSVFIILAVILVAAIILIMLFNSDPEIEVRECFTDVDCVPSRCCDAPACVSITNAPANCTGVECPTSCNSYETNLTGCALNGNQAACTCINHKCTTLDY